MDRTWNQWAPLPLRLMLGFGFLFHGFPKIFSASGHQGFVDMLQGLGIPAPGLMAWVVGVVEVFGGLALLLGAFVAWAAVPLAIDMLVATFTFHRTIGFDFMNVVGMGESGPVFGPPGFEVPLLYLAGLIALVLAGAGPYSIDALRWHRRRPAATATPQEREQAIGA